MLIVATCACGKEVRANESLAGQEINCILCRRPVKIPDPNAAPPAQLESPAAAPVAAGANDSPREYLYWLLALAFFPLAFTLSQKTEDMKQRFERAVAKAPAHVRERVEELLEHGQPTVDDVLNVFPGGKLDEDAYLPRRAGMHLLYAAAAVCGFFALVCSLFAPGTVKPWQLFLVGLFTGTFGIAILLIGYDIGILSLLLRYSVMKAADPTSDFLASWAGFTFGVGLVEEFCKLIPLIWLYRRKQALSWRVACLWGLASGAGFGINEGIMYSEVFYNGISPASMYVVRFISCVGLHAVWSASAGISLYLAQPLLRELTEWYESGVVYVKVLLVVMFLHGLFDTLLTRNIHFPALMVAAASFAWLAWQIEKVRSREAPVPAPALANGSA